jgi:hypothetical protein
MSKGRVGLHKEISSIFSGVPVPKGNGVEQPAGAPAPAHTGYVPPKTPAPSSQHPPLQKPQQSSFSPPQAPLPEQLEADTTVKTPRQIPWQHTWLQIKNKLLKPKPGVSVKRQMTVAVSIPVLFIILIFVVTQVFSTPSRKMPRPAAASLTYAASGANKIDWQIPDTYPAALRDPMQFGSTAVSRADAGNLILKGIVYSEDSPSAVVGTQIVRQGDKVSGATVVKISRDSVEFEMDGKRWTQKVQR